MTWDDLFRELDRIAALADDWDREGAAPPSPAAVAAIRCLARTMRRFGFPPPGRAYADRAGAVSLDWQGAPPAGAWLNVEATPPGGLEIYHAPGVEP